MDFLFYFLFKLIIQSTKYHYYRSLIKQVWNDEVQIDVNELSNKIYKSYCDGEITPLQYDSLCTFLCDL